MTEIDIDSVYKEITGKDWSYQFDRYIASNFAERIAQIARQPLLERIAELEQALRGMMDAYNDLCDEETPNYRSYLFRKEKWDNARKALEGGQ